MEITADEKSKEAHLSSRNLRKALGFNPDFDIDKKLELHSEFLKNSIKLKAASEVIIIIS